MALKSSTLDDGIGLIEPSGSLIGGDETDALRRTLADFSSRNYDKLIIDLSSVSYLNSTAIGVLVAANTSYAKKGWQLKLCGLNKNLDSVFVVTKLTLMFDVCDTRKQAIAGFR
jgi:anti-sigma B factor antagonist